MASNHKKHISPKTHLQLKASVRSVDWGEFDLHENRDYYNLVGREFELKGIVSNVRLGKSMLRKPYLVFDFSNKDSSMEILLLGNDYVLYNYFAVDGNQLCLKGEIDLKNHGIPQLVFSSIEFIADL